MEMVLESLIIENFKGIRDRCNIDFSGKTDIKGQNGAGKTTIADAFFWLFLDESYSLVSNPSIRPTDSDDAIVPTVTANIRIDGKPICVVKSQKLSRSKPDENGVTKVSLTNSYLINDVPKSERDFKAYLEQYGIDFEKFAQFSHPDIFVAGLGEKKKRDAIRNTLFNMAQSYTDIEIAQMMENVDELTALLKDYTIEEVTAMQNATIRKIKENYGKDGEILRAKIEGLEAARIHIDVAEMELAKRHLEREIKAVNDKILDTTGDTTALEKALLEVNFDLNTIKQRLNQDGIDKRRKTEDELYEAEKGIKEAQDIIDSINARNVRLAEEKAALLKEIEDIKPKYAELKAMTFAENDKNCPYCGQMLPESKLKDAVKAFEEKKAADIKRQADYGNGLALKVREITDRIAKSEEEIKPYKERIDECTRQQALLKIVLEKDIPETDYTKDEQFNILDAQRKDLEKKIEERKANAKDTSELEKRKAELIAERERVLGELAKAEANDEILVKITECRMEQKNYEQQKANAEKIIYQLSLVSQKKNELLEESVNKNFEIVKFKLFDFLKNGTVFDTCVPLIDGFEFGKSTNTGREVLAKLDIIKGLQKFYGQAYPVFLDGAEALSDVTKGRIAMNCQLIMLSVTEDKTLVVG